MLCWCCALVESTYTDRRGRSWCDWCVSNCISEEHVDQPVEEDVF